MSRWGSLLTAVSTHTCNYGCNNACNNACNYAATMDGALSDQGVRSDAASNAIHPIAPMGSLLIAGSTHTCHYACNDGWYFV